MDVPNAPTRANRPVWVAALLIVLAGVVAYVNSLNVPFLLDDAPSIVANPTVHRLWPLSTVLNPPHGSGATVEGRPLLNLSFALNYALSGPGVESYHVGNVVIHLAAALALFGIVRRTLLRMPPTRPGWSATGWAGVVALLWLLHPLQTEAVTYIAQRAESLMGLWFLLTLYGFVRATEGAGSGGWLAASVFFCACGMATKEVMVGAPIVVCLYDVTFVAGGWRAAWERRRVYYLALACTWLILACLVFEAGSRGGTIGPKSGVAWWQYALTQSRGVVRYVGLALWPHPLVFDYGSDFVRWGDVWPYVLVVGVIVGFAIRGLYNKSVAGFLLAAWLIVLAPSSSVVGGTRQMVAEHRMYLALAAVTIALVCGCYRLAGRRIFVAALVGALAFGGVTVARNQVYRTARSIWSDTVAKRPDNAWAQNNLGLALLADGHDAAAIERFRAATRIDPSLVDAQNNLGNLLLAQNRTPEALDCFRTAAALSPGDADVHSNLGNALLQTGRTDEAIAEFREAIRLLPTHVEAHNNLANALAQTGRVNEALTEFQRTFELQPDNPEALNNWGNALLGAGQLDAAIERYRQALKARSNYAEAHSNLGNALARQGRLDEAMAEYREAVALQPNYAAAHASLGNAYVGANQLAEAVAEYETALKHDPNNANVHFNLAVVLVRQRRFGEAEAQVTAALRLRPDFAEAQAMAEWLRRRREGR